jgi:hypothetical protein
MGDKMTVQTTLAMTGSQAMDIVHAIDWQMMRTSEEDKRSALLAIQERVRAARYDLLSRLAWNDHQVTLASDEVTKVQMALQSSVNTGRLPRYSTQEFIAYLSAAVYDAQKKGL